MLSKNKGSLYIRTCVIFLCGYMKCSILYKGGGSRLNIFVCYLWEMAIKVALDVSFDSIYGKGIREKAVEVRVSVWFALFNF
jgi:hypothetical protein